MYICRYKYNPVYKLIKKILFLFDPEKVHYFVFKFLKIILKIPLVKFLWKKTYQIKSPLLETEVAGIKFPNPIGLAAGFDKNALMINELASCGFGFIEIGTVTPIRQLGNEKKRLFRIVNDNAIINRMGFNNDGAEVIAKRLKKINPECIIGGNIGKNKITKNKDAINDYLKCFNLLEPYVDYFVVNVSSPNTPNLRDLQEKEPLTNLLEILQKEKIKINSSKPIFLKIAPDLTNSQLDDIIEITLKTKISGLISTNTTTLKSNLTINKTRLKEIGEGGVSGKPLTKRSTEVIRYLHRKSNGAFPIIGVGGIHSAQDAIDKLNAGASLLQIYTGFIYEGPSIVKKINKAIIKRKLEKL